MPEPSKPCHIWVETVAQFLQNPVASGLEVRRSAFKTLSHLGLTLREWPSKPCRIWESLDAAPFKTLSHLGTTAQASLQNPVASGSGEVVLPSKPCRIWGLREIQAFKTLSHLGF